MYKVNLSELSPLYRSMIITGKQREHFNLELKKVLIDVFFLIDREPFELLIGVRGYNIGFVTKIYKGFWAETIPDNVFWQLCSVFHLRPQGGTFNSKIFLKYIAENAPRKCGQEMVRPEEMARYYRDRNVADEDKIYFFGWRSHHLDNQHVTEENLEKTRFFFGAQVAEFCRCNNISSAWTDEREKAMTFQLPTKYAP